MSRRWPWEKFLPPELRVAYSARQTFSGDIGTFSNGAPVGRPGSLGLLLREFLVPVPPGMFLNAWDARVDSIVACANQTIYPLDLGFLWLHDSRPSTVDWFKRCLEVGIGDLLDGY